MPWDNSERAYYFGADCAVSGSVAECGFIECKSIADQAFLERYCSSDSERISGTKTRLEGVPTATARCVLNWLASLFPTASHVTPGWNASPLPLVVIGNVDLICRVRQPRLGLCVVGNELFLWSDQSNLEDLDKNHRICINEWVVWRERNQGGRLMRHRAPLSCLCPQSPVVPPGLSVFIEAMQSKLIDPPQSRISDVIQEIRNINGDPTFDVIAPRDVRTLMDDSDDEDDLESDLTSPETEITGSTATDLFGTVLSQRHKDLWFVDDAIKQGSMLGILRAIAIERVRTEIKDFDGLALDHWIMATGYAPNAYYTQRPHQDTYDLLYVFAASLANAGGHRPPPEHFATLIAKVLRAECLVDARTGRISRVLDFQSLIRALVAAMKNEPAMANRRMLKFQSTLENFRDYSDSNLRDVSLIKTFVAFSNWLLDGYEGSAEKLHATMRTNSVGKCKQILKTLRSLDALPGVGVAIAANFVKDSQIPAFQNDTYNPRSIRNYLAACVAKPDLHVTRLMAKITRDRQIRCNSKLIPWQTALAYFQGNPTASGKLGYFSGDYSGLCGLAERVLVDIQEWANACNTSALEIDRVLYLIGARRLKVKDSEISRSWYDNADSCINRAIQSGVGPRT